MNKEVIFCTTVGKKLFLKIEHTKVIQITKILTIFRQTEKFGAYLKFSFKKMRKFQ